MTQSWCLDLSEDFPTGGGLTCGFQGLRLSQAIWEQICWTLTQQQSHVQTLSRHAPQAVFGSSAILCSHVNSLSFSREYLQGRTEGGEMSQDNCAFLTEWDIQKS